MREFTFLSESGSEMVERRERGEVFFNEIKGIKNIKNKIKK
jgi:hypothetical protein